MAKWKVELISKESDRSYVYDVAYSGDATQDEVFQAALAAHGHMILIGAVDEVVWDDRGAIQKVA